MSADSEQVRRKFHTLDGMRGVAAILVVTRHGSQYIAPFVFPNSFLAVDLFFMLSGFVIAAAYDDRLRTGRLTPLRFMLVRYIRLWPLYLMGTLLGAFVLYSKTIHGKSGIDLGIFWRAMPTQLMMLPSPGTRDFYTYNLVAWSLFFELFINFVYALVFRRLNTAVLAAVAAASVVVLVYSELNVQYGINNGWLWSDAGVSFARVGFAFSIGVLIYRHRTQLPKLNVPSIGVILLLASVLMIQAPEQCLGLIQIVSIVICFPLLVVAAVEVEPSRRLVPLFTWLGVTSYAVYNLHHPLLTIFEYLMSKASIPIFDYSPWSGFAAIALIMLIAWIADRVYDVPVRAWLTQRTLGKFTSNPGRAKRIGA